MRALYSAGLLTAAAFAGAWLLGHGLAIGDEVRVPISAMPDAAAVLKEAPELVGATVTLRVTGYTDATVTGRVLSVALASGAAINFTDKANDEVTVARSAIIA
jgi:hypothetical protein